MVAVLEAEAVFEATEAALCERSIVPAFGATSAVAVSGDEADEVAAALLEPEEPSPQAASVSVAIVHRRVLRIM